MTGSARALTYTLTASLLAALLSLPAPATASHGGDFVDGTPDNKDHYVDRNEVTAKVSDAVQYGISQLNRSVMNATLNGSGDVEVYDAYYGTSGDWSNTYARTHCGGYTPYFLHCDVFVVRYNMSYFAGYTAYQVDTGGCHELGHTAGLAHRPADTDTDDNSCMRKWVDAGSRNFDAHDLDAINGQF